MQQLFTCHGDKALPCVLDGRVYLIIKESCLLPIHDPAYARNYCLAHSCITFVCLEVCSSSEAWKAKVKETYPNADMPPFPVPSGSPVCAMKLRCTLWKSTLL